MASRFGNRTYGRQNKVCAPSIQFEKTFVSDKTGNRPSAAKSTGMLHKWGKTSFTSTRSNQLLNGQKEKEKSKQEEQFKKPKLELDDDPFSFGDTDPAEPRKHSTKNTSKSSSSNVTKSDNKVTLPFRKPNKFFKSGNRSALNSFHGTIAPYCKESKNTPLANAVFDQMCPDLGSCCAPMQNVDLLDELMDDSPSNSSKGDDDEDFLVVNKGKTKRLMKSASQEEEGPSTRSRSTKNPDVVFDTRGMSLDDERTRDQIWSSLLASPAPKCSDVSESSVVESRECELQPEMESFESKEDEKMLADVENVDDIVEEDENVDEFVEENKNVDEIVEENENVDEIVEGNENVDEIVEENENVGEIMEENENIDENVDLEISFISDVAPTKTDSPANSLDFDFLDSGEEDSDTQVLMTSDSQSTNCNSQLSSSQSSQPVLKTRRIFNSPKKTLYKHRPWHVDEEPQETQETNTSNHNLTIADEFDEEDTANLRLVRVTTTSVRSDDESVTSVRCSKKLKELYKVVRNVKQAHQCHESGETQEFNDDIEYLLGGLQNTIPVSMRCLSILSLASKCMAPGFRMHLRAEGTISQIFSALTDAPADSNVSLCTATLMFVLSQDRLNMDLDKGSLELMLQLLESDSTGAVQIATKVCSEKDMRELDRNRIKVRELCEEVQRKGKGHAKHLNLDHITVTLMNNENQLYLIDCKNSSLIESMVKVLKICIVALPSYAIEDKCEKDTSGFTLMNCILSLLKVFLNLTNDNSKGCSRIGEEEGLIEVALHCMLHISKMIPPDQVFDLLVLMLGMLINLMEQCTYNRKRLLETQVTSTEGKKTPAVKILVDLFLEREQMAQREQVRTDRLLDGKGDQDSDDETDGATSSQNIQDIELTITKALQKAGKHMEDSMVAAYVSLLLGCFIEDNE
uniref:WAPL domain-containing protein n=1 Tax=Strigamia maritima TaxID=126957 RepID=T1IWX2_STRMM